MSYTEHIGLSEEDVKAAEVLDVLRNSHGLRRSSESIETQTPEVRNDGHQVSTLLDRVRRNSLISNMVSLYEMNTRKRLTVPDKEITEGSNALDNEGGIEDVDSYGGDDDDERQTISKRQKISNAIAKGRGNFKEYRLNMSIGSKKRLITCLHLLKLANKQLTQKVAYLQEQVENERSNGDRKLDSDKIEDGGKTRDDDDDDDCDEDDDDEDDDEYFDASESIEDDRSIVIKMEVVGTVKKVYSLISKFAGNSLPEPARTQVRQTLLNLPTNWSLSVNNSSSLSSPQSRKTKRQRKPLTANGKVLILAEESLNVVKNVTSVVDSSLGKAEEWVKQKQELKETLRERFMQQQWKKQVRNQLTREKEEEERASKTQSDNNKKIKNCKT